MKTKKRHHHCQRKQNLSHHNGNCLSSVPVDKTGSPPSPLQNPPQSAVVSREGLVHSASHTWLLLIKCQFSGAGRGDTMRLGEGRKPLSSPAWTTHCPFLREGNGNKKPTGQGFCKWNSGLTDWSVATIRTCFLGPCLRLRRMGLSAHSVLH